ncbi:1-acylglycerol-3-phosphate O-acyltransferase [Nostocoides japonicum T1-X7]|uniref:1-acylglycerol-3-phosphate O-acyltransferase n=1 Tax=Nostocoides japonicum T1-X7 TaxID=1194083 RepID=A0A077LZ78_9MICO|nr:lysophospholipid acyltransferase family protein [Tetrasphaera japonica]CCH78187.1 1-acylglycerol-3-phosphate O-acyltransferase [Tetrasphaera japonica T1-X7]
MYYTVGRAVLRPLTLLLYRPTITGLENVPESGGCLIASNHLSFIDSFAIPLTSPRKVSFLAKSDYFEKTNLPGRALAQMMSSLGAIPVDRRSPSAAQDSLESALAVVEAGGAFGIYPEGTRSRDGRLYRGRTGVAWLALKAQVPVVPVGLVGTDQIQPVGNRFPRIRHVEVHFGAPIQPTAYAGMPSGRARRALTDDVMDAIAALSGQARAGGYATLPTASDGPPIGI